MTGDPLNGTDVLLLIDSLVVGPQRGVTFDETNDPIDFSSKDQREMRTGYGRYSSTVSLEFLYVPNASGYAAIRTAARAGTKVTVLRREQGSAIESAPAVITSKSDDFPDQAESVISLDLQLDGAWVASP